MDVYLLLSSIYIWGLGITLAIHTGHFWKKAEKKPHRFSEILQVLLFLINGIQILFIFDFDSQIETDLAKSLLLIYTLAFFILFGLNVFPNMILHALDPQYRKDLNYLRFIEDMEKTGRGADQTHKTPNVKDISRKALHIIQFAGIAVFYYLSITLFPNQNHPGLSSVEFRNYAYVLVAGLFWITMIIGDLTRMGNWKYLPKWAMKWFRVSLDLKKEKWTINGATSILLANLLWIPNFVPIQVFFVAAWVSCISDAVASFIGSQFGKHKITQLGKFPTKTWEGLIAGLIITVFGVSGIFYILPTGISLFGVVGSALVVGIGFTIVDLYGTFICDNLLNSIVSGLITWVILWLF